MHYQLHHIASTDEKQHIEKCCQEWDRSGIGYQEYVKQHRQYGNNKEKWCQEWDRCGIGYQEYVKQHRLYGNKKKWCQEWDRLSRMHVLQ